MTHHPVCLVPIQALAVDVLTGDQRDDLLVPARRCFTHAEQLDLPSIGFGIAHVHAEQVGCKESGFLTTFTASNLQDRVALIVGIGWEKQHLQATLERH